MSLLTLDQFSAQCHGVAWEWLSPTAYMGQFPHADVFYYYFTHPWLPEGVYFSRHQDFYILELAKFTPTSTVVTYGNDWITGRDFTSKKAMDAALRRVGWVVTSMQLIKDDRGLSRRWPRLDYIRP